MLSMPLCRRVAPRRYRLWLRPLFGSWLSRGRSNPRKLPVFVTASAASAKAPRVCDGIVRCDWYWEFADIRQVLRPHHDVPALTIKLIGPDFWRARCGAPKHDL